MLYTTGYARNAISHEGRLDPRLELLTKPFSYAQLATRVRELVDSRGPPCLLVVEDEFLVRMAAVDALQQLSFRVEEAASATEAINKARVLAGRIDAAIIDIGLPDRKGDARAAELRAMVADLPIVIASGYGQDVVAARFKGDRGIGFVGKPYSTDQLAAALRGLGIAPPAA